MLAAGAAADGPGGLHRELPGRGGGRGPGSGRGAGAAAVLPALRARHPGQPGRWPQQVPGRESSSVTISLLHTLAAV